MSDSVPEARSPAAPPATSRSEWPDYAAARAWPEAAPPVTALAHGRGAAFVRVRVEPTALAAYQALAVEAPMPEGARVAAFHEAPDGQQLGVYILQKRAGVWSALQLDARGRLVQSDGRLCLRCHEMAPTDHLFGIKPPVAAAPAAAPAAMTPTRSPASGN